MEKRLKACLIGDNVNYSVSPKIYEFFAKELGFDIDYSIVNLKETQIGDFITSARKQLDGFNITVPHKRHVMDYLDSLDNSVVKCGACNLVKIQDGKLIGYNTDGDGVVLALGIHGVDVAGKRIVMAGAGGAAMAIAHSLDACNPACITALNRTPANAETLCASLQSKTQFDALDDLTLKKYVKDADVFINASMLGQLGYDEFDGALFLDGCADTTVFDINYSNPNAKLPIEAKKRGLRFIGGKWMVACQAAYVIKIWLSISVEDEILTRLVTYI